MGLLGEARELTRRSEGVSGECLFGRGGCRCC